MWRRPVEVRLLLLVTLILIPVLLLTLNGVEAGRQRAAAPPDLAQVVAALESPGAAPAEATAVGYVYYDGAPVAGADVTILRDDITVFMTTTAASGGGLPSFTVNLSQPPIFAAPDDILTLQVEYSGQINWTNFRVQAGEQTLAGRLSSACGLTEVPGGMIASDTTWTAECGPYFVRGNVQVMSGATLTVEAGATILFDTDLAMLINGALLSQGTADALVTFTSGQVDAWGYLSFGTGTTGSALSGTLVESAGGAEIVDNAAIRIDGATVTLSGVIVRGSESDGIQVFNDSAAPMDDLIVIDNAGRGISIDITIPGVSIQNSIVSYNGGGGILVEGSTEGAVSGNAVEFNGNNGIRVYFAVGPITVSHNRIVGNEAVDGGGLYFRNTRGDILNNYIVANEASGSGGGVYFDSTYDYAFSRNFVLYNRATDKTYAGAGMYLYTRSAHVTHNVFAANLADQTITTNPGPGAGLFVRNYSSTSHSVDVSHNSLVQNFALTTPGGGLYSQEPQLALEANTIVDNIATSPVSEGWGGVHLVDPANLYHNNLFDNQAYDLYNGGELADGTVNAQANWWGTVDAIEISQQVYDWADDATRGVVDYANWLSEPWSAAPVSPPAEVETAVNGSSLTVSWRANPEGDLAGYKIYLDTSDVIFDPAIGGRIAPIDVGLVTSFTLTCLPPDTYYLVVTAYDDDADGLDDWIDGNESWFSREVHDTTATPPACSPPAGPTALSAAPISSGRIDLAWTDNAADETDYRVERSANGGADWSEVGATAPDAETYGDSGLSCGVTYHYRVRAYRAGDGQYSAYSNVDQATTINCPPAGPTGLNATAASASQIDLDWTDNAADETAYRVERSPNGSTEWSEIADLPANSTAHNDSGLACGATYYYRVRAYRAGDGLHSAYSNAANATTIACPPAAPTGLSATAVSTSRIDLAWTDNAGDETGYRVERSPNGSTDWSEIVALGANSTAYSNSSLTCGATYYYRVRAYRSGDGQYSAYSNIAHDTTDACTAPAAPSDLSAAAWSAGQINLNWTDNAGDETAYLVERSPNGSDNWAQIATLGANSTGYGDTGLACGESYYYRVRAYRAGDGQYSAYSNVDDATTDACPPPVAPGDLLATGISATQINLSWTDNANDESAYLVERSPDGIGDWSPIAGLPPDSTGYSDTGLACGMFYYYRVRVHRAGDGRYSGYSNVANAETAMCELKIASCLPLLIKP